MRRHALFPAVFACLGLLTALPAHAESTDAIDAAVTRVLGKVLSEQNLSLVFGLLRQSLAAAADGKPAPELSAEATARLEASGKEMQREMLSVSVLVLDQVEKEVREAISAEIRP
jgi:hypothetical protein